jgi:hypothetical protein
VIVCHLSAEQPGDGATSSHLGEIAVYQIKELKFSPGGALVSGLNELGDACGTGNPQGAQAGVVWYHSGLVKQRANSSFSAISSANIIVGIESPGDIVGAETETLTPASQGLLIDGSNNATLKAPPMSQAICVSDPSAAYPHGAALGLAMSPSEATLHWLPGQAPTHLKLPANITSFVPRCINVHHDFCGGAGGPSLDTFMLCQKDNWIKLTNSFQVWDMNNTCQMVGTIIVGPANNLTYVPAMWNAAPPAPASVTAQQVPLLPGFFGGHANGINDANVIVGTCYPFNPAYDRTTGALNPDNVAFLFDGTNVIDLNKHIHSTVWRLQSAIRINNTGKIVGLGTLNGVSTSFLLE